jgi:hypothetical protein
MVRMLLRVTAGGSVGAAIAQMLSKSRLYTPRLVIPVVAVSSAVLLLVLLSLPLSLASLLVILVLGLELEQSFFGFGWELEAKLEFSRELEDPVDDVIQSCGRTVPSSKVLSISVEKSDVQWRCLLASNT